MLGPDESIYTMAANSVLDLIIENNIDPNEIGFLALGTESSTDNSAGTIIIKGMVNDELKNRGMNPISNQCEVPEFKQACLSGIYALKNAVRYVHSDAPEKKQLWFVQILHSIRLDLQESLHKELEQLPL